ncbi:MAG: GTP pyrophosphokinase family protein [Clostridia bacterium]|nr:GTP pyrophosphokinase family protein [Clostridia bacterium]
MSEQAYPSLGYPDTIEKLQELDVLYTCAMREICTKLENLQKEFEVYHAHNPIRHITHRLKKPKSILGKMKRRELPLEYDVMRDNITDIGGVRVICPYIDDIYALVAMLKQQDDILVVKEKDYIKHPKPNGYRSYHLIVGIPVFFSKEKQIIPVEIQMRTLAMDFWASLEHQMRYKAVAPVSDETRERLTRIADTIFNADMEMQEIYKEIHGLD